MIKVYKSETGQFVLVHAPTQTFIIDENLENAYAKLQSHIAENYPEKTGEVMDPLDRSRSADSSGFRTANVLLLVFLALLPFVWLLVMHHSLASLITDLRWGAGNPVSVPEEDIKTLREDVDFMRFEQNRVLEVLYKLTQEGKAVSTAETNAAEGENAAPSETKPEEPAATASGNTAGESANENNGKAGENAAGGPHGG